MLEDAFTALVSLIAMATRAITSQGDAAVINNRVRVAAKGLRRGEHAS